MWSPYFESNARYAARRSRALGLFTSAESCSRVIGLRPGSEYEKDPVIRSYMRTSAEAPLTSSVRTTRSSGSESEWRARSLLWRR